MNAFIGAGGAAGTIVLLLTVAIAVAIAAHHLRVPYTVALVVAGLALGALHALQPPALTQGLLYTVFLPGLIFEAAFNIRWPTFRENARTVGLLALPGVVAALFATAGLLTLASRHIPSVTAIPWQAGLVFGALIAATDPVAVVALFRQLGVPARLRVLLEGESLLNDGTAIVCLSMVLSVLGGTSASVGALATAFVTTVGAGVLTGAVIGVIASLVIRTISDAMLEITVTSVAAYGAFIAAESVHASGVLATVTAGLLCGNYAAPRGMSPASRRAVAAFWEYVAFALNSLVFLLLGFTVQLRSLLNAWPLIALAFGSVLVARAGTVYGATAILPPRERIPASWRAVLVWGGLRGALSVVLALGLPAETPARAAIVTMTIGVVAASILLQATTVPPVLRRLGVARQDVVRSEYERLSVDHDMAVAGRAALDAMVAGRTIDADVAGALCEEYDRRIQRDDATLSTLHGDEGALRRAELDRARRRLLMAERTALAEATRVGALGSDVSEALGRELDNRFADLDTD